MVARIRVKDKEKKIRKKGSTSGEIFCLRRERMYFWYNKPNGTYILKLLIRGEVSMEAHAGTGLQPFNSRYHSEQACMEALIATKWRTVSSARALTPSAAVHLPVYPPVRVRKMSTSNVGFSRHDLNITFFSNPLLCPKHI
jgi:hypothetical protein